MLKVARLGEDLIFEGSFYVVDKIKSPLLKLQELCSLAVEKRNLYAV